MRILLLTGDVWNDGAHGNDLYSNWFEGFEAEFANIYLEYGIPKNKCCTRYFQVTDKMMARSFFSNKAGRSFVWNNERDFGNSETRDFENSDIYVEDEDKALYTKLKSYAGEPLRLARDILWSVGRYDLKALRVFIDDFNPDIVFCPHLFSIKYRRIERIIHSMTDAPMVAFAGDVEASLKAVSWNPLFWMRRIHLHYLYGKHVKLFKYYFTFSQKQCEEMTRKYGVPAEPLYKCADIEPFQPKEPNKVIKLVYAGRLYCNRWKTISAIGDALKVLNSTVEKSKEGERKVENVKAEVYVYSQDKLTKEQQEALSEDKYIHFMGATHPSKLPQIYEEADIALHVESFDKKYMYETMHSLSTKIITLMSSTCAIMAICWDQNNGWNYLKKEDAAICISDYKDILPTMQNIVEHPEMLAEYAKKANECGLRNHSRGKIQEQIKYIFNKVINGK